MALVEPVAEILAHTGQAAAFRRADGSKASSVTGIFEDGSTSFESAAEAAIATSEPHITVPDSVASPAFAAANYGEGDFVTVAGVKYRILDPLSDGQMTTYRLARE